MFSEMAEQIETKHYRYKRLSMTNKKFPSLFDLGHIVWQPYWIEGKILNNVYFGTAASIDVKLHNYDIADMGNVRFKFQLDQPHGLAIILE